MSTPNYNIPEICLAMYISPLAKGNAMPAFTRRRADEMLQKVHQTVIAVKIIQITVMALNPAAAADRIRDGTWLVAPGVTKP